VGALPQEGLYAAGTRNCFAEFSHFAGVINACSEHTPLKTDSLWTVGFGNQTAPKHYMLVFQDVLVAPEPGLLIVFGSLLIVAAVLLQRVLLRVTRIDSSQDVDPHLR
jgi:hypothetical protein